MPKFLTLFFSITPPQPKRHFQEPKKPKISQFIMFFLSDFMMKQKPSPPKRARPAPTLIDAPIRKTVSMPFGSTLELADTPSMEGTRWCTYCLGPKNADGGMWMILQGGITRRWLCVACAAKHRPFSAS